MKRRISPIVHGAEFALPFGAVIMPRVITGEESNEDQGAQHDYDLSGALLSAEPNAPSAFAQRFIELGVCGSHNGLLHTLYFTRRPITNRFVVEGESKVSGYLSHSYLKCGSSVVGLVFSTDRSKTHNRQTSLRVLGGGNAEPFEPNFNLEKMGLLMFVGRDSTVLVVPNDLDSPLLVKTE